MTEPEQLELDFTDDEFCPELYPHVKIVSLPIWDRAVGYTASSYEPPQPQPRRPLWKTIARLLLMPVALVYHIGLGIFCMIALPILWIGIIVRGLFHTFL